MCTSLCIIWSRCLLFVLATVSVCSSLSNNSQNANLDTSGQATTPRSTQQTHYATVYYKRASPRPFHARSGALSARRSLGYAGDQFSKLSTDENSPPKRTQRATNNQITVDILLRPACTPLCHFPKTNFRNGRGKCAIILRMRIAFGNI